MYSKRVLDKLVLFNVAMYDELTNSYVIYPDNGAYLTPKFLWQGLKDQRRINLELKCQWIEYSGAVYIKYDTKSIK